MEKNNSWSTDPRLQGMDPHKIEFLQSVSEELKNTQKNSLVSKFMQLQQQAKAKGYIFSEDETAVLVNILTANLSQEERNRFELFRSLAKRS